MHSAGVVYRRISQQFITCDMFSEDVLGSSTDFLNGWNNAFLSFLKGRGVSMSPYEVDGMFESSFLGEDDSNTGLLTSLPLDTYAFGFGRGKFKGFTKETLPKLYADSQKNFYYHFKLDGFEFASTLSVLQGNKMSLAVYSVADGVSFSFVPGKVVSSPDILPKLLTVVFDGILSRDKSFLETTNYSEAATAKLLAGQVKSSLSVPALTKYDIQSLLSDASPSKVWYSPEHRLAIYQCRFGSRLVTFSHFPSCWRVSTLRQCWLVKSDNKLLVSRKASFYEESLSVTAPYKTAVMFRTAGQNHYLPLE